VEERATDAVGESGGEATGRPPADLVDRQARRDVPATQPFPQLGRERLEPARRRHSLTRQPVAQLPRGRTARPRLDPPVTDTQVDADCAVEVARVAHERGHTRPRARRHRSQAGPRPSRATRCQQRGAEAEHDRRPPGERERDHDQRDRPRHRHGGERASGRRQREHDGGRLAHTVT
jgi:hypothetical protein